VRRERRAGRGGRAPVRLSELRVRDCQVVTTVRCEFKIFRLQCGAPLADRITEVATGNGQWASDSSLLRLRVSLSLRLGNFKSNKLPQERRCRDRAELLIAKNIAI